MTDSPLWKEKGVISGKFVPKSGSSVRQAQFFLLRPGPEDCWPDQEVSDLSLGEDDRELSDILTDRTC
jgi:hypothetical protein